MGLIAIWRCRSYKRVAAELGSLQTGRGAKDAPAFLAAVMSHQTAATTETGSLRINGVPKRFVSYLCETVNDAVFSICPLYIALIIAFKLVLVGSSVIS